MRTSTRPRSEHELFCGRILVQTRGDGGGDSTPVECLFSITLSYRRAEEEAESIDSTPVECLFSTTPLYVRAEEEEESIGGVLVLKKPPASPPAHAAFSLVNSAYDSALKQGPPMIG